MPSFVSPSVTSPSVAFRLIVKSIQRTLSSPPKRSVRSSSQTFLSSLIQSLRVTIFASPPLALRCHEFAVCDVILFM